MTVKSGQIWAGVFVCVDSTGAKTTPTIGPSGTLYVDGAADAAIVGISGSNPYTYSVILPTLAGGQHVDLYIEATIDGVDTASVVNSDQAIDADTIAGAIWSAASRTLTQSAEQVAAAVSGSSITITRGDTVTVSLTGLGSLAGRSKLYSAFKTNKGLADSQATMLIEETAGITVLNGATHTATTDVTLTVMDEVVGNITFVFKPPVSSLLPVEGGYYDVQMVTAAGVVTTVTGSTYQVSADVARVIA